MNLLPERATTQDDIARAVATCPKHMTNGPCGGVRLDGSCEVDAALPCPYLNILSHLPWRSPDLSGIQSAYRGMGRLERTLRTGDFALIAEAYTPDSADLSTLISTYTEFKDKITAVNIAEHALASPHASTLAAAAKFEQAGTEAIINLACRDRNRIGLQGELLGAAALGVKNIFCVTGDHPALGDQPDAVPVFDLDSLELIALSKKLRDEGELLNGRRLEQPPNLFIGAAANPFSPPVHLQAERVAAKVAAGATFIQTQGIFDLEGFAHFTEELRDLGVFEHAYLVAGVAVVTSLEGARWLQKEVPGARVPDSFVDMMRRTSSGKRREVGLAYAADLIQKLRDMSSVSGALLFPLHGDTASLGELLDCL